MSDMVDIYAYHGESIYSSQCIYIATGAVIQRGCKAGGRTFLQPFGNFSAFFMAILFLIYIFAIVSIYATWHQMSILLSCILFVCFSFGFLL